MEVGISGDVIKTAVNTFGDSAVFVGCAKLLN